MHDRGEGRPGRSTGKGKKRLVLGAVKCNE